MKANRSSFQDSDEAVSPVIGVILMVAITVVLAAVAFVLVGNVGGESSQPAQAAFQKTSGGDGGEILVVKVGGNGIIDVTQLSISPATCVLQDAAGVNKTAGNLAAGDRISCSADGPVTIVDGATQTLIYSANV